MIVDPLKNMCLNGNLFAKLGLVSPPYNRPNKVIWHNGSYVSVGEEPSQMIVDPLKNMYLNGNLFAKLGLVSLSTPGDLCRLCSPTSPAVHSPNFTCLFDLWSFVMVFCSVVTSDILYTSKSKLLSSLVEILPACNPPKLTTTAT